MKEELKEIIKEIKHNEILQNHIEVLNDNRQELVDRQFKLQIILENQFQKIDRLNNFSLASIVNSIFVKKSNNLESLRHEYFNLSIELNGIEARIEKIDFELSVLKNKVKNITLLRNDLRGLLINNEKEINEISLLTYRKIAQEIKRSYTLSIEIEEAIKQGEKINRKLNSTIKYLEKSSVELAHRNLTKKKIIHYNIEKLEKYKKYVVEINHHFLLYEAELNDVYKILLDDTTYTSNYLEDFMNNYRINLLTDLAKIKTLNSSWSFLSKYKELVLNLNRMLRKDLKQIKKELIEFEEKENKIIQQLTDS